VVDVTYAFTNAIGGASMEIFLIGQTNGATNHTITFTAAGGATINHFRGTNGPNAFVLFSNSVARVTASVVTNLTGTNVLVVWESDSAWPQRMQPLVSSAGGGTSNVFSGGRMYYDGVRYTNHSTVGNFTNLASVMIPAHTLTNIGDSITGVWRGRMRAPSTNTFILGYGTDTNIFSSPIQANTLVTGYQIGTTITRTDNATADAFSWYEISTGSATVIQTNWMSVITPTHGTTNIFRLQAKGQGAGGMTNMSFTVEYQPASR
jgi:hypothetical protein